MGQFTEEAQQKPRRFPLRSAGLAVNYLSFSFTSSGSSSGMSPAGTEMDTKIEQAPTHYKYTTMTGYFLQDDPSTDQKSFDFTTTNFGLINRTYDTDSSLPRTAHGKPTQWQRFAHKLHSLNREADKGTRYNLLYLARHGEGWHNRAVEIYGEHAWDCYYSTLDGDGEIVWADAHLTPVGTAQALGVNAFWKRMIAEEGVVVPERFYVSPLERCLRTARLTWEGVELPERGRFDGGEAGVEVKELLREGIGIHTCDRRSSKSYIETTYPSYRIEAGFQEVDPLWIPDLRESDSALKVRLRTLLDDVFRSSGEERVFSLTSHGGATAAMLKVLGHRNFALKTGTVVPVLVKVEEVEGKEPVVPVEPWQPKPDC